ncbi:plasmid partitioning protein RepA [Bosea massiliensis]|uniref:Plasmid partitioning protein RepA n=1 Tax=Bosea massiliensis TaxID=151419 RepID=A0ABW0P7H8_9HYPH
MSVPMLATPPQRVFENPDLLNESARRLANTLKKQRMAHYEPGVEKTLRKFTCGEVAKIIGVADSYLRQLTLEGKGPMPEILPNNRRMYSLEDINALRAYLDTTGRSSRRYLKHRRGDEHLQVISCINFKGGSAKTTSAAHLAQYLAIQGYRVLAIDVDPQASLTSLFGLQPEMDLLEGQSLYGSITYDPDVSRHPSEVIKKTYFPNLDLIPAALELSEFETETAKTMKAQATGKTPFFYERIGLTIAAVEQDYDVVVLDCPPQLGYLTMSALGASTSLVITIHPQMLDVMSMASFLEMAGATIRTLRDQGAKIDFDWIRYLVTRYEARDLPQRDMVEFLRNMFGDHVFKNEMVKSTAISDAGVTKQTLYEVPRDDFSKDTYDRAIDSMNGVNGEIEQHILKTWGRAA